MEWTNYHHLFYFYTAVKQGGISKAAEVLRISQPTVSKLISTLESEMGETLWEPKKRGQRLTESGEMVFQYAEEIFSLGREMREVLKGAQSKKNITLTVGLHQALPKLIAARVIMAIQSRQKGLKLKCIEGPMNNLLTSLKEHKIDVILSDSPASSGSPSVGFSHLLLESEIGVYASKENLPKGKNTFPHNIKDIKFILPSYPSALRQAFDEWCHSKKIQPDIVAECDDSGLMKTLGGEGMGAFIAPVAADKEIISQHNVKRIGIFPGIKERTWLISVARKVVHPVVKSFISHQLNVGE